MPDFFKVLSGLEFTLIKIKKDIAHNWNKTGNKFKIFFCLENLTNTSAFRTILQHQILKHRSWCFSWILSTWPDSLQKIRKLKVTCQSQKLTFKTYDKVTYKSFYIKYLSHLVLL